MRILILMSILLSNAFAFADWDTEVPGFIHQREAAILQDQEFSRRLAAHIAGQFSEVICLSPWRQGEQMVFEQEDGQKCFEPASASSTWIDRINMAFERARDPSGRSLIWRLWQSAHAPIDGALEQSGETARTRVTAPRRHSRAEYLLDGRSGFSGVNVFWNAAEYNHLANKDDWSFRGLSDAQAFNASAQSGYVYLHALVVNTNDRQVEIAFGNPTIEKHFDLAQYWWLPNVKGTEFAGCGFLKVLQIPKSSEVKEGSWHSIYSFSPQSKKEISLLSVGDPVILAPNQTVLVKWSFRESQSEYPGLLSRGALPTANCSANHAALNLYGECNGSFDASLLNFCAAPEAEYPFFSFFSVSNMSLVIRDGIAMKVDHVKQFLNTHKKIARVRS